MRPLEQTEGRPENLKRENRGQVAKPRPQHHLPEVFASFRVFTDRKLDFVDHEPDVVLQRERGMKT